MVVSSSSYIIRQDVPAPLKFKFSEEIANDFVINEVYLQQSYFWSQEWQAGEKEADEDIQQGRVKNFKNAKNTIKYLHSKRKK